MRCPYPVIDKDLALLLAPGLDDAHGGDLVERGDAELLIGVGALLGVLELSEERLATLVLDLLGRRRALGLLGLWGDVLGGLARGAAARVLVLDGFCSYHTHCDGKEKCVEWFGVAGGWILVVVSVSELGWGYFFFLWSCDKNR